MHFYRVSCACRSSFARQGFRQKNPCQFHSLQAQPLFPFELLSSHTWHPPDFGNTPGIPWACRGVEKTLPGGKEAPAEPGRDLSQRLGIKSKQCAEEKSQLGGCALSPKRELPPAQPGLSSREWLCRRFLLFPGNDSLDSSGEGRPRAAEVENPNQNKAICTSQTGLAVLIN